MSVRTFRRPPSSASPSPPRRPRPQRLRQQRRSSAGASDPSVGSAPRRDHQGRDARRAVPAVARPGGTIRSAPTPPTPPNEYVDDGKIVGMDVDLGNAIGEVLGVKMKFTNSPFDAIIPGIQSGKYDLGISSFTANAERQKVVNFATYFNAGTQWAVQKGNPQGVDDRQRLRQEGRRAEGHRPGRRHHRRARRRAPTRARTRSRSTSTRSRPTPPTPSSAARTTRCSPTRPITAYAVKHAPAARAARRHLRRGAVRHRDPVQRRRKACVTPYSTSPRRTRTSRRRSRAPSRSSSTAASTSRS